MTPGGDWAGMLREATTWVLPVVFAVTFHEAAHGFVAYEFGDDTAARAGRLSLNPLNHIDPFGTVLLPAVLFLTSGFLFGYAKPVPVNFGRLRHPRWDTVLVALAGPATNVALAIVSALLFYAVDLAPHTMSDWLARNLVNSLQINAVLCVFNMLPFPPLDGGRVAVGILPRFLARPLARVEPYGMLILLLLFVVSYAGVRFGLGFNLLGWLIGVPAEALMQFVLHLTGIAA
ncbi:MAG TPA: site-2 protease family protein [Stellaceae bacterium]|nr:site-2 protease family protein [Stellaceae bacterium]